ncbi:hypothetical protein GCM10011502_20890 [Oceanisphaera marina]|uniref:Uncharacterized protein n=1 Tax=Oceanisphaera marina TaxID=2017550 RepID=A0ABQ1INB7_9GAMM|nr:hypothetical protein GCM10011502_20890 [Oceanisphaera marina]
MDDLIQAKLVAFGPAIGLFTLHFAVHSLLSLESRQKNAQQGWANLVLNCSGITLEQGKYKRFQKIII